MKAKELFDILEANFTETGGMYIGKDQNEAEYISDSIESIRKAKCEAFQVEAKVYSLEFPQRVTGTKKGYCLAHNKSGYWLVYHPEEKQFYCFWGATKENLGSRGVFGNALYCWTS